MFNDEFDHIARNNTHGSDCSDEYVEGVENGSSSTMAP